MKKAIVSIMIVLCVALAVVFFVIHRDEDQSAPEISVPDTQITYTEGDEQDPLLEGVTAYDDQDGDVTDSVQIDAIRTLAGGNEAIVVYVAKDSSNNIASVNRVVKYISEKNDAAPEPSETESADAPEETQAPEEGADTQSDETASGAATTPEDEAAALAQAEEAFESLPAESPRLTMMATAVTVAVGGDFSPLNYVREITDDNDSRDELYHRIQIRGDYDINVPGTYELTYYVTDSDSNQSNTATLTLNVVQ